MDTSEDRGDDVVVHQFVQQVCLIDEAGDANKLVAEGLDLLAMIANNNSVTNYELHSIENLEQENAEEPECSRRKISESLYHPGRASSFSYPDETKRITDDEPPCPRSPKEFLQDLKPRDKRTCLATHIAHCNYIKNEEFLKQLLNSELNQCCQQLQIQQLRQSIIDGNGNLNKASKRKHGQGLNLRTCDGMVSEIPPCYLHEPHILRLSVYEKFVRQYLYYYNTHDTDGMVDNALLPCCSNNVVRQNYLWGIRPVLNPINGMIEDRVVVVDDKTYIGVDSFKMMFNMIFDKLPDAVMVYEQSRIRYDSINKETQVFTPLSAMFTCIIPQDELILQQEQPREDSERSLTLSVDEKIGYNEQATPPRRKQRVELEATGWNVLKFNEENKLICRVDHVFIYSRIEGIANVDQAISGEAVCRALWRPS